MNDIQNKKKDTFTEAKSCSLDVLDNFNNKIALLVPIGSWALHDGELLDCFAKWREKFMSNFLAHFTASKESTKGYLKNLSIKNEDRILFAIYFENNLIGHIGLSNVTSRKAEIDNLIRSDKVIQKNLMYFCEKALLSWAFNTLKVETVEAKVLSFNFKTLLFHSKFGLKLKKKFFLRKKVNHDSSFSYEICEKDSATEKFFLYIIEVTKSNFFKIIGLEKN